MSTVTSEPLHKSTAPKPRGPLPRILLQWLPTEELRRDARMAGGNAGEAGEVRQLGIESHMPEYPMAFAIAELQTSGAHNGKFLLQVGFSDAQVRYTAGAWTLDGRDPKPPHSGSGPRYYHHEPPRHVLIHDGVADWRFSHVGDEGAATLRDRIEKAVRMVKQDNAKRDASMAVSLAKGENHPMFNMDAFERVSHIRVDKTPGVAYLPPTRLWKLRAGLTLAWLWLRSWVPGKGS